jgi:hypothetical protein
MGEPEKDLDKLREEQAEDDADLLAALDKESKEFDKAGFNALLFKMTCTNYESRTPKSTAS